ncbi:MAG TPA: cyanophycin synthetase, partial [Pyrinomonadaceae bacterium]|nr:cyanophycin synthetase [Pyrinomonadaceae bacterium]
AVMLDAMTRTAGIRTALYTSPHLVSITERMRFEGREIEPEHFARLTARVREAANGLLAAGVIQTLPTFFEHLTVIFLLACLDARTELAILETGLGGRLDATTAAGAEVVAITPIALDHQEYLGETLLKIAAEKAAIIRPGVTAIVAPQPPEVATVIEGRGAECGVTLRFNDCAPVIHGASVDGRLRVTFKGVRDCYEDVLLGLRGRHQVTNACVAIQLAEALHESGFAISHSDIIAGLQDARHAGRLEIYDESPRILFDGAHNIAGAKALRDYLDEFVQEPVTLVFGAMRDKDLREIAAILFPVARSLILTQPSNPRAATPEMLAQLVPSDVATVTAAEDLREALGIALTQTERDGLVCVTGSLYLVGEAQSILGAR